MQTDLVGKGGIRTLCRAGPEPKGRPPHTTRLEIIERGGLFSKRYACGHRGDRWVRLHVFGTETKKVRQNELCPDCLLTRWKQHFIHCGVCGHAIAPVSPVVLYEPGPDIRMDIATILRDGSVVGCMHFDCCECAGFFAGYWTEDGFVPAFPGGRSAMEVAGVSGAMIINL
jgi:hypothetical protein